MKINPEDIYSSLVKYSADGLVLSDQLGIIYECNSAFGRLINRSVDSVVGQKLKDIIECDCNEHDRNNLVLATNENTGVHNATVLSASGVDLTIPVSHIVIKNDGLVLGYLTVVYIVQAGSVQQAQTEFVSTVSHELRTPLTSIKGFADTILRAGDRLDIAQHRRYVGIIKDQADRLTRLVEDLLAVSRLESRKLQLTIRAIDLNETVQRVLRNLADKAREHEIINKVPAGLSAIWADSDRLEQILTNLIDNAVKYSPDGTVVTVSAREIQVSNSPMIEFSVCDQGPGIPAEHLTEIFNKFSRLDNPLVRQTEGTGLGLYITRSLVLALGGQIKVESKDVGTTFTVCLPAATLEEQAARGRGQS